MNTLQLALFILINIISFSIFAIAIYRFREHKIRYLLADKKIKRVIGGIEHGIIILIWFFGLIATVVIFSYLLLVKFA